MSHMFFFVK